MRQRARLSRGRERAWAFRLRRAGLAALALALLPLVAQASGSEGDGGFASNLALLDRLTRQAVEEAADSLHLAAGAPVTVLSTTWSEANWFVGNLMAQTMARRGHPVQVLEVAEPPVEENGAGTPQRLGGAGGGGVRPRPLVVPPPSGAGGNSGAGAGGSSSTGDAGGAGLTVGADEDTTGAGADSLAQGDPLWGDSGADGSAGEAPAVPVPVPAHGPGAQAPALPVRSLPSGSLPQGEILDVRVVEFGVQYADAGRALLFGPLKFTRIGGVYLQVSHLEGPGGEVKGMVSAERHEVDRLSDSDRILAEGASYPFTRPDLVRPSLGRYIEPTVVVAIVRSLVYLFYSNQN